MNNKNLTLQELEFVQNEVNSNKKNIWGAYVLTLLLWPIGVGRAYLGKQKSAIARIALTVTMIGIVAVMMNFSLTLEVEEIAKQLVSSTVLAMSLIITALISLIMLVVELVSIPKWVKEIDEASREEAVEKAIKGRYVSEKLMKDAISQHLIDELKVEVKEKVVEETKDLVSDMKDELHNNDELLPKSVKVFDEVANDEDDPIEEIDKYLNIIPSKDNDDEIVEEVLKDNVEEEEEVSSNISSNNSNEILSTYIKSEADDKLSNLEEDVRKSDKTKSHKSHKRRKKIVRRKQSNIEADPSNLENIAEENEYLSINKKSSGTPIGEILKDKDVDLSKLGK